MCPAKWSSVSRMMPDCGMVIVAAGSGSRMGGGLPKQFMPLCGVPLYLWSARCFDAMWEVRAIVIVGPVDDVDAMAEQSRAAGISKLAAVVRGGALRQESVLAGLRALPRECAIAGVHDGARPFPGGAVAQAIASAREHGAAILAAPVPDTIKRVSDGAITQTLDRTTLWAAQTPQLAGREVMIGALERCASEGREVTDEASALEACGVSVCVVASPRTNIKVTTPEDWIVAQAIAASMAGDGKAEER